jgi:hypothetical protein
MNTCTPRTNRVGPHRWAFTTLWIVALCLGPASMLQARERIVEGLWGSTVTTPDHPSWRIEDRIFRAGPRVGYDYLRELLSDPANEERTLTELAAEVRLMMLRHARELALAPPSDSTRPIDATNDPAIQCEPLDLGRILMGPRPFSIGVDGDDVIIRHEEENTIRRIPLGRSNEGVGPPSRFGTAAAHFEGDTLVVESTNIVPMPVPIGVTTTNALRIVERYSPDEGDADRLEFELTLDDPGVLREPLVLIAPRVRIEGELFVDPPCELISGELESGDVEP